MARKDANGLTDQQRKFCDLYLANGLNASKAYMEAYPSCKSANAAGANAARLLGNDKVSQYLSDAARKASASAQLDAEWVLSRLMTVVERCMSAEPVMVFDPAEKGMVESGEWKFDSSGANKALELLGKYKQLFTEKREVKHSGTVAYQQNLTGE